MSAQEVTVFVRSADPDCAALLRWLQDRGVAHRAVDVLADASASAILFGRLGRVVVPALLVGDRLVVGYDPVQLARLFPRDEDIPRVTFGAAVRSVTPELARQQGLPWTYGVEVGPVKPGSPAEAAGIRIGDLIVAIGAYTLQGGADQFRTAVAARQPGDTMSLTVRRAAEESEVTVEFPKETADIQAG